MTNRINIGAMQEARLKAKSIKYTKEFINGRETIVITPGGVPEIEQQVLSFFAGSPCWFENCREIRAKFEADVKEAESKTGSCTGCHRGSIIRKYEQQVKNAILTHNTKNSGN